MLNLHASGIRLCDGVTRREMLRVGSLGLCGLSLPQLLQARQQSPASAPNVLTTGFGNAKSCIILFLMGGPPQHSTWDPKPDCPPEIRGEFKPIPTAAPGIFISELMPHTARQADKLCILRAVSSNDNAHSSSGYYMLTGHPHQPMNFENANPGPPNDYPSIGGMVRRLRQQDAVMPAAVTLPHRIFNTDGSIWPGQDAGFLGRTADPWLFSCTPAAPNFQVPELTLSQEVSAARLQERRSLLDEVNHQLGSVERSGLLAHFDRQCQRAFDLLRSPAARQAFRLDNESPHVRDRYGRSQFGQSVLLARRLVQAGVALVQVNWFRGANEPPDNPCWDSHINEAQRLKTALAPPMDRALSALVEDLADRGMLDETLVVCMAEFGRTPRINRQAGRDHWGQVYSAVLAGGGIRGGQVHGASDKTGAHPKAGKVQPQDLTATIFHCLGHRADTTIYDTFGRPLPLSRGEVIRHIL
jgi:Protein of unknown function (DUF1501)